MRRRRPYHGDDLKAVMARGKQVDKSFLGIVIVLLGVGALIFSSASLGLLARTGGASFGTTALKQFAAILIGGALAYAVSKVPYQFWRRYSFYIFAASIVLTLLVFVPKLGFEYGGGKRWVAFGPVTFQPAEFLKIAFVMYLAAWLSAAKNKVRTWRGGMLPVIILLVIAGGILLKQPDTDTFISIVAAAMVMFLAAGGRYRDVFLFCVIGLIGFAGLVFIRPYLMQRVTTFFNPSADPLGAGYQIQQSLIAVGSGKFLGRGFGQSIQKFNYLPEPIGDSIFAVAAEEFGFVGSVLLVLLFFLFTLKGFQIASRSPDMFGGLLVVGIVILIMSDSFMNIGSMLGVLPLSGLPLLFVSQGGSAMVLTLFQVGILLNISKYRRT